jgi:hypothetical protein
MVVPFDAGGSNDRFARIMTPALSKELGQPRFDGRRGRHNPCGLKV